MDNASYTTLTRQSGLLQEMQVLANNIANASTTGYRAEGILFSEHIKALGPDAESLSMATARVRDTVMTQGSLAQTGGTFDLAIEGEGFFLIETPQGQRLTRSGVFGPNDQGDLVTADGYQVLDAGGAPVFVPVGVGAIGIGADGTISADGAPIGQIGLYTPADPNQMVRESGTLFDSRGGIDAAPDGRILQGYLESANVNPIQQISLALFLTYFVMEPVFVEAWTGGIAPLMNDNMPVDEAFFRTMDPLERFMAARIEADTFATLAALRPDIDPNLAPIDAPLSILIPSFLLSEMERAFQVGFLIFIPFLIIDLVVAAVLMSMGMMMVPPAIVSLPFKLAFFVVADGWGLIASSLVRSYG